MLRNGYNLILIDDTWYLIKYFNDKVLDIKLIRG